MRKQKITGLIAPVLEKFSALGTLTEREVGEYAHIRKNGMSFHIRSYQLAGLGYLSTVEMQAFLGLMRMDTLIFTPVYRDAPLFSFDRAVAMGLDTLMLELYDLTVKGAGDLSGLARVGETMADLPDHKLGERWYDYLQLPQTVVKRTKKADARYVAGTLAFAEEYIRVLLAAPECGREEKLERIAFYVDGLFTKGSPTVEQFEKLIGKEAAWELYRRFVFSSRPE